VEFVVDKAYLTCRVTHDNTLETNSKELHIGMSPGFNQRCRLQLAPGGDLLNSMTAANLSHLLFLYTVKL
jgi:hypothetical protein